MTNERRRERYGVCVRLVRPHQTLLNHRWWCADRCCSLFLACNDSTSTFAERTIYDRLYFFSSIYRGAESDLKAKARSGRARDVQIKDLKVYYLKVIDCMAIILSTFLL